MNSNDVIKYQNIINFKEILNEARESGYKSYYIKIQKTLTFYLWWLKKFSNDYLSDYELYVIFDKFRNKEDVDVPTKVKAKPLYKTCTFIVNCNLDSSLYVNLKNDPKQYFIDIGKIVYKRILALLLLELRDTSEKERKTNKNMDRILKENAFINKMVNFSYPYIVNMITNETTEKSIWSDKFWLDSENLDCFSL